jgi:aspartyl-tRNA(Asn)/glutamyl-tRNA(Gln) amidotransferase subunit B
LIREIAAKIGADNPENVEKYRGGKDSLIGWFVGQVMRESRGKADPNMAREVLEELLRG